MILHGFLRCWGLPDLSPFVTKLDCYLRMTGTKFEYQPMPPDGLASYPQGKAPYIDYEGQKLGDSSEIIAALEKKNKLDGHLLPEQRALGLLMQRTLERDVYYQIVQNRWIQNFDAYCGEMGKATGAPADFFKGALKPVADGYVTMLKVDGMGRHPPAFYEKRVLQDFEAIDTFMGSKPY
ncbi:MAG TPA: glutathione S-transferase N-terminal domain-containing protein, partial [Myxococcota bacterium]|nr:glutathione S-transferase N-terminal domain-containing protein [Myxococcota bacterium]